MDGLLAKNNIFHNDNATHVYFELNRKRVIDISYNWALYVFISMGADALFRVIKVNINEKKHCLLKLIILHIILWNSNANSYIKFGITSK